MPFFYSHTIIPVVFMKEMLLGKVEPVWAKNYMYSTLPVLSWLQLTTFDSCRRSGLAADWYIIVMLYNIELQNGLLLITCVI